MGCKSVYLRRIAANCLNIGTLKFKYVPLQVSGTQNLCNGMLYNSEKLRLLRSKYINKGKTGSSFIRVIDFHELLVKGEYLEHGSDSIKLAQLIAHLKAGNGSNESVQRGYAAEGTMNYLEQNESVGNYVLSGDMNTYRASEKAYQEFTKYSNANYAFVDPLNAKWDKYTHTQSTRTGNCGGMDDRFDMTLVSKSLKDTLNPIRYIESSYRAVGQDGKRYNQSVTSPTNTDVPSNIAQALYNLSDHLPVVIKVEVQYEVPTSMSDVSTSNLEIVPINGQKGKVLFKATTRQESQLKVSCFALDGQLVKENVIQVEQGASNHELLLSHGGIYILRVEDEQSSFAKSFKILVH
jgi:hypothetical protein